jgi:outer membrane murein-binding lipoprotein Lpp
LKSQRFPTLYAIAIAAALSAGGCGNPSQANIDLRKENQQLHTQVDQLQHQRDADRAAIAGFQGKKFTGPVLPSEQLDRLFTTTGLQFGRLTGGYHPDPNTRGDTMLKVYVVPTDDQGDALKAAGTFEVDLFDLALSSNNRIGHWEFDLPTAKSDWYGKALLYTYVLPCPWQTPPTHQDLQLRVTFADELTHRVFTETRQVTVQLPPSN